MCVYTYITMSTQPFILDSNNGISGSLTNLTDGSPYLIAGANVTITTQSNGAVLIVASTGSVPVSTTYGNGSDGAVTISSNTTLARDMYYSSLSVSAGVTLQSNGYRIFVSGSCVVSGTIANDGSNGTNNGGVPGAGGAGGAAGTLGGGGRGVGSGGAGLASSPNGVFGVTNTGGAGNGGSNGGTYTWYWHLSPLGNYQLIPEAMKEIIYSTAGTSLGITGGVGGGEGAQGSGGGGGGVIAIIAHDLTVITGGSIHANGGNWDPNHWGGGGAGGLILIVTANSYTNNGTIACNGGTGFNAGSSGTILTYLSQ